jgi:hypothetical protein
MPPRSGDRLISTSRTAVIGDGARIFIKRFLLNGGSGVLQQTERLSQRVPDQFFGDSLFGERLHRRFNRGVHREEKLVAMRRGLAGPAK